MERPPKFVPHEVVRVVAATGRERDENDDPFDATSEIGREAVVQGAVPDGEGWMLRVRIEAHDEIFEFPEDALETTGKLVANEDADSTETRPHDPERDRWRDDVLLSVITDTRDAGRAAEIAEDAAAVLAGLDRVDEVEWRLSGWEDEPYWIELWAWSDTDALKAFGDIVGLVGEGWEHDEDEEVFVSSKWTQVGGATFLALGISEADVSYRRWTSPERRSRSEIATRSH